MEYTVAEAEVETGVGRETIRAMLRDGLLEGYMEDGAWVVPEQSVDLLFDLAGDGDEEEAEDE